MIMQEQQMLPGKKHFWTTASKVRRIFMQKMRAMKIARQIQKKLKEMN
jgi:hypothetical protein